MADKVKLGNIWLSVCSGCELAVADIQEAIVDVLGLADFEFMPVLMDVKYDEWTDVDVAIVSGGIRNDENRELALKVREKAKVVIALGTCACYGGLFGLGNLWTPEELAQEAYVNSESTYNDEEIIPSEGVPHLESRVRPLSDVIDVDLSLPGCPPRSDLIAQIVMALLQGEELPEIPQTNLCEVCPREKPPEGMAMDKIIRQFELGEPDPDMCLVPQGLVCMGPATTSICGAECPSIAIPCRGCYGPTFNVADQGAKMISAIGSDFGVEQDKTVDPEEVANELDDIVGTFYTYTLPAALVPLKMKKEGK
jgi:F420-non-reducing hydrogenase small subunit